MLTVGRHAGILLQVRLHLAAGEERRRQALAELGAFAALHRRVVVSGGRGRTRAQREKTVSCCVVAVVGESFCCRASANTFNLLQ